MPDYFPQRDGPRRHPDLFTDEEAAVYLHLESVRTLEWIEKEFHLPHFLVGRRRIYHREDLDNCVLRMTGRWPPQKPKK